MRTTEGQQECGLRRFSAVMALHVPVAPHHFDTLRALVS